MFVEALSHYQYILHEIHSILISTKIPISIVAGLSGRCVFHREFSDAGFCRTLATLHLLDLRAQCLPYMEGRH